MLLDGYVDDRVQGHHSVEGLGRERNLAHVAYSEFRVRNEAASAIDLDRREVDAYDAEPVVHEPSGGRDPTPAFRGRAPPLRRDDLLRGASSSSRPGANLGALGSVHDLEALRVEPASDLVALRVVLR